MAETLVSTENSYLAKALTLAKALVLTEVLALSEVLVLAEVLEAKTKTKRPH